MVELCEFEKSQLQVELCPVTYQVAFFSVHVRPNGNKLNFHNVSYQQESGVYQCVAENTHGMIVSYTVVKVRGKYLENYINIQLNPHSPIKKVDFFVVLR